MASPVNQKVSNTPALSASNLSKVFQPGNVKALTDVSFTVKPGTIHAVIGENGAGKSTLMNILSGDIPQTKGEVLLSEKKKVFKSPKDALTAGIGLLHQHVRLVPGFPIWKNIILGIEPRIGFGTIDKKNAKNRIHTLSKKYTFPIDLDAKSGELLVSQKQIAGLFHLLLRDISIIALDEPTAPLTQQETQNLFSILLQLKNDGKSIIFITHKLKEVFQIADTVTVLRKSRLVTTLAIDKTTEEELSSLMVGKEQITPAARKERQPGDSVLSITRLSGFGKSTHPIKDVSFHVRQGEILGITGMREHGLEALEDILAGIQRNYSGTIVYKNTKVEHLALPGLRRKGVAYIPTDRLSRGASLDATMTENMILLQYRKLQSRGFFLKESLQHFVETLKARFNIIGKGKSPLATLSGGNIQRVILSRELSSKPDLIILCEPSWGLDFHGRAFLYNRIFNAREQGCAVLVITTELDEIIELSDRIGILYNGSLAAVKENRSINKQQIGEYMLGIRRMEDENA
ncbi:MAG: ABC transporter ATP-binding protein [Spirochaetia bacterium]